MRLDTMTDNNDPHEDLSELESAIHYLKEAETLHNGEEYNPQQQDAALEKVDEAIDEVQEYVDSETTRLMEHSPVRSILDE